MNLFLKSRKVLSIALLLLVAPAALAQRARGPYVDVKQLPDTPAGRTVTKLLEVINANDPQKVRDLVTHSFSDEFRNAVPMDEHVAIFGEVYQNSQGMDFYGIRTYNDEKEQKDTVAIVRTRLAGDWRAFVFEVEPNPPHRITRLNFAPARPPSDLPPAPKLSDAELPKALEAYVKKLADSDAFSGTVLLAKDGKPLFTGAYGQASRRYGVPNKLDTKFNLGSMNKMFTGVAIAQLVQAGKLSFDDPVGKYLSSEWLPADAAQKIKIGHLLTHTSGLGSYFNQKFMQASRDRFRQVDDYKELVADDTPQFEPGTQWSYSNTGFLLLGAVVEKVAGQPYFDYVRENIYKPAGMVNSDCYDMDEAVPNLAMGHLRQQGKSGTVWKENTFMHVIRGGPAGGGYSTVEDLLRFDQALRGNKLLNPEMTQKVLTAKPELSSPEYGFGFGIQGTPKDRVVGHTGGFPGISASLEMFLDSGYTAVVLSNADPGSQAVVQKIREMISAR